jgi:hypothetical protein
MTAKQQRIAAAFALLILMAARAAAKEEMFCPGAVVPLTLSTTHSPYVRSSLGGQHGYFQVDTGATLSTIDARRFGRPVGARVRLEDFDFPTVPSGVFTALDFAVMHGPADGPQIGQIGTDLLQGRTAEFHYETTPPYLVISEGPCPAENLQAAGFVAIAQRGYFGSDRSALGSVFDNTPVIFMRIGSVSVPAWIDTGLVEKDRSGVVQVNQLVLHELRAAGVAARPVGTARATNCLGRKLDIKLWRVADEALNFATERGQVLFSYPPPLLSIMPKNECSGPGNVGVPVARIGAAYVSLWRSFVLDAAAETLWLAPSQMRAPAPALAARPAMAVALAPDGSFAAELADTLDQAKAQALAACAKQSGGACAVRFSVPPTERRCFALARNLEHQEKVGMVMRRSPAEATQSAMRECMRAARSACTVNYTRCNG